MAGTSLTDEDRLFLQRTFAGYGEAWRPGLDLLEAHHEVAAEVTDGRIVLSLTMKVRPRARFVLTVDRATGRLSRTGPFLPDGPELDRARAQRVDAVLRGAGTLLVLSPEGGEVRTRDVSRGLDGLRARGSLTTRLAGDAALLFVTEAEPASDPICLCVDLRQGRVVEAHWIALPPRGGRLLSSEEQAFLDAALRRGGDFGVYGNVTAGLSALLAASRVAIRETAQAYHFDVSPRDGHGHGLGFSVVKGSGSVQGVSAGHEDPEPDLPEEEP